QKEIFDMQRMGLELSEKQKESVTVMEGKMSGNEKIKAFMEASHKFETMLQSVNMIISRALSGDEGCGCGSDCGDDCGGGCGGGCGCN
ncbi:MAG TPA: YlbF family regulator, partial [Desulfobacteria bacterium]|nr:YlbF family regulator [Desulfobacteria bacterium]